MSQIAAGLSSLPPITAYVLLEDIDNNFVRFDQDGSVDKQQRFSAQDLQQAVDSKRITLHVIGGQHVVAAMQQRSHERRFTQQRISVYAFARSVGGEYSADALEKILSLASYHNESQKHHVRAV